MEKALETYNQAKKQRARSLALSHAVEVLTSKRSSGAVVNREYVAKVRKTLLSQKGIDANIARQCDEDTIHKWELFWDSKIGVKNPGDLMVAYLAGPEPMNDFRELVNFGVHPHNIYGFESHNKTFNIALENAKRSEFPLIKIIKMPLDKYLQAVPQTFDIIYFDACGPLPSSQATLRTVANIFRYQRLNPLGVLITNFAKPDISESKIHNSYSDLVSAYLYPKGMLESGKTDWNLAEGAISNSKVPKEEGNEDSFFHEVKDEFSKYYGQYITRQLFDIASFIVPISRLSANQLWSHFFNKNPKELTKLADGCISFQQDANNDSIENEDEDDYISPDNDILDIDNKDCHRAFMTLIDTPPEFRNFTREPDGDYIVDADMYAIGWAFASLRKHSDRNYLIPESASRDLINRWLNELGGLPQINVEDVVHSYLYLSNGYNSDALTPEFRELLNEYGYIWNMHQFCDVPTKELSFFPALAQYAMPYHYNVAQTRRYSYVAEGKSTEMFLDVIPFDTCRYIYDWLPSTELIAESFDTKAHQLAYRFAMDGLLKHSIRYNNEYVFGGTVISVFEEGYTEHILTPRENLS